MAGTALATQIITAVDAYIAGVTPPVGENLVRQDLFEALFGAVEDWVGIQDSGQSVSANTTLTKDSPRTTKITTGATDMTVTLPVGSTCRDGQRFRVFKADSGTGNVSFARQSTDTINGVASLTLLHSQYSYIEVEWMGSGLWAITPGGPEYGSNSNGEYIVFSNGLQICWSPLLTHTGAGSLNTTAFGATSGNIYFWDKLWTFPAAFMSVPSSVTGGGLGHSSISYWPGPAGSTTAITHRDWHPNSAVILANTPHNHVAIGWAG